MTDPGAEGLRVLLTNRTLATRTGTELYLRDLAISLASRGHQPVVYSPLLGSVAEEIRSQTIPVTSDLATIAEPPDVIHGHHALETLASLLAFPGVPAIAVCHSWIGWADAPVAFPRISRYVAVDETCRDRLRFEHGIPDDRIHVVLNSVDTARFKRRHPLPPRPRRALLFSNAAGPRSIHRQAVLDACEREGIELEVAGASSGRTLERPDELIGEFDIVFAKAKAAIEAMSVGAAVVLCDAAGAGPMVTMQNVHALRRINFGMRALRQPLDSSYLSGEIRKYDEADAAKVSDFVRTTASTESMVDTLCSIYEEVLEEQVGKRRGFDAAEARATSTYLQAIAPRLLEGDTLALGFRTALRKPILGGLIRYAARSPGRAWLRKLIERGQAG